MQVRVDWVLRIFGTQVIKKKRPVRPVFPDYLSVSYDYGLKQTHQISFKEVDSFQLVGVIQPSSTFLAVDFLGSLD